jgi:hypothetical protein
MFVRLETGSYEKEVFGGHVVLNRDDLVIEKSNWFGIVEGWTEGFEDEFAQDCELISRDEISRGMAEAVCPTDAASTIPESPQWHQGRPGPL